MRSRLSACLHEIRARPAPGALCPRACPCAAALLRHGIQGHVLKCTHGLAGQSVGILGDDEAAYVHVVGGVDVCSWRVLAGLLTHIDSAPRYRYIVRTLTTTVRR